MSDDEIRRRLNPHIGITMDEHSEGLLAMLERIVALEEEAEGLRKIADGMARAPYGEFAAMMRRAESAEAENERLRELLREGQLVFDNRSHKVWAETVDSALDGKETE